MYDWAWIDDRWQLVRLAGYVQDGGTDRLFETHDGRMMIVPHWRHVVSSELPTTEPQEPGTDIESLRALWGKIPG